MNGSTTPSFKHVPQCNIWCDCYANTHMKMETRIEQLIGLKNILAVGYCFLLVVLISGCVQDDSEQGLQLGGVAPDFAVKDLSGNVAVLSNFTGSPVILRFFETDCRFCRADTAVFKGFYSKNKEKGLHILYIGSFYENREALQAFIEELGIGFPVAMDMDAKLADLYDIRAYPQTLFISPDQKLLAALLGGVSEAEMVEILGEFL